MTAVSSARRRHERRLSFFDSIDAAERPHFRTPAANVPDVHALPAASPIHAPPPRPSCAAGHFLFTGFLLD